MKKLSTIIFLALLTTIASATVSKTINVATAGTLGSQLTATEKNTVTSLTVTGTIDARDFKVMRDSMHVLMVVDISSVTISAYTGSKVLTSASTSYPANKLPAYSFSTGNPYGGAYMLQSVTLPSTITSIGNFAFYYCPNLTSVIIPNSVTTIGQYAFCSSNLSSITIPNSVTTIGYQAFSNCNSNSFIVGLTSITIPSSVTSIGNQAFANCQYLTQLIVQNTNPNYSALNGVLFSKNQDTLITYPQGKQGSYAIPSSVTKIADDAFHNCWSLTSVTIPNSVTAIGNNIFNYCYSLVSVTIPSSVTSIGYNAFQNCALTSLTIPSSVTTIGDAAFYFCTNLQTIYCLNNTPPTITATTFTGAHPTNVYVPTDNAVTAYKADANWIGVFPDTTIKKNPTTGTTELTESGVKAYANASELVVEGTTAGETVKIYTINGQLIKSFTSQGESMVVPVAHGIYLIKIATQTIKVSL